MNKLRLVLNNRMSLINQKDCAENLRRTSLLYVAVGAAGTIYFLVAYSLFHSLWYHKFFAIFCTLIFMFSLQDLYFEQLEQKIRQALPKTTKKLSHYYTHYRGSVIPTIKETEEKCSEESKYYLIKIRKALLSGQPHFEIEKLKSGFPYVWYRMLASILFIAKEKGAGTVENEESSNIIGSNLGRITNILSFINVQQGYNDAELKFIQMFLYFAPFMFVFGSDWINAKILVEMNMLDVYQGLKAQNLRAYIFLTSNLSALFIHWMRKQQI